ncbi:MAG TPA: response regulator [Candidatus Binatia bacterium]|nr:response regulator [Candidatus Binatia bacterium]
MKPDSVPVLVVDDNLGFLRVVQAILEKATPAFSVHTVESGTEALAFLERQPPFADAPRPAFIVLDFHLPDMNAPSVLGRIGAKDDLREIPVLVLSQAAWEEDEAAARAAGARQFKVKPSRVQALRDAVVSFWKEHAHGRIDPTD